MKEGKTSRLVHRAPWQAAMAICAAAFCSPAAAADQATVDAGASNPLMIEGSVRSRLEAIDGQFRPNVAEDDFFWSIRSSLLIEYDAGPVVAGGRLIDARGYGQKRNSSVGTGEVNAVELVEAYVGLKLGEVAEPEHGGLLKLGRFQLSLGAGRLIAIQNFRNTANGFTGANLDWNSKAGDRLVAFWMMPQIRLPNDAEEIRSNEVEWDEETSDLQLFGASYTKAKVFGQGSVELYAFKLNERDDPERPTRNRHFTTVGGRAYRAPGKGAFDFDMEGAYQFGRIRASSSPADRNDLSLSAAFAHAEVGKKLTGKWSPRLSVHLDYGTGDGPGTGRYGRFDSLYGSGRSDLGPSGLYGALGRSNIIAAGPRLDVKPTKRLDAFVSFSELWLEEATDSFASTGVRDRLGRAGSHAGRQIEMRARYWLLLDALRAELGGAYLGKGRFLQEAAGAPPSGDSRYAYFDLTFEF